MYKNITIVNAHWNNRGGEAALLAFIEKLQLKYPTSMITIIIKDGKSVKKFLEIKNVTYFVAKFKVRIWEIWVSVLTKGLISFNKLLKKTVGTLNKSDFIIYSPGGSVISDRAFWWKQVEYLTPFIQKEFDLQDLFSVDFRDKIQGWYKTSIKIIDSKGKEHRQNRFNDLFYSFF